MNNKKQKQNNNCNAQYTVVIKQNKIVQEYNVIRQIRMIIKKNPGKTREKAKILEYIIGCSNYSPERGH